MQNENQCNGLCYSSLVSITKLDTTARLLVDSSNPGDSRWQVWTTADATLHLDLQHTMVYSKVGLQRSVTMGFFHFLPGVTDTDWLLDFGKYKTRVSCLTHT